MSALIRFPRVTRGVAILEFTLVALPLLLAALTVLEFGRWQLARTMLSHALLEAARGGQSGELKPQAIAERFEQAVLPLWPTPHGATDTDAALLSLRQTAQGFQQRYGFPLWQIHPATPPTPASVPGLVLELTWWHRPWVPGMQALLRQLGRLPPDSPLRQGMASSGWLPIRQRIALEWHLLAEQAGVGPATALPAITPTAPSPGPHLLSTPPWHLHEAGVGSGYLMPCRGNNCTVLYPLPPNPAPPASPSDPELCGTVLCCAQADLAS